MKKKVLPQTYISQLEFKFRRLDDLQAKKEAAARQELAVNQALTLSNAILSLVKAAATGGGFLMPATLVATLADLMAGYAFVKTLTTDTPGFYEGVVNL